jgi:hypothetical protein
MAELKEELYLVFGFHGWAAFSSWTCTTSLNFAVFSNSAYTSSLSDPASQLLVQAYPTYSIP